MLKQIDAIISLRALSHSSQSAEKSPKQAPKIGFIPPDSGGYRSILLNLKNYIDEQLHWPTFIIGTNHKSAHFDYVYFSDLDLLPEKIPPSEKFPRAAMVTDNAYPYIEPAFQLEHYPL